MNKLATHPFPLRYEADAPYVSDEMKSRQSSFLQHTAQVHKCSSCELVLRMTIVVLQGFRANGCTTAAVRRYVPQLGYDASH